MSIGDKLYEFAIMSYEDFDKLKAMYTQLIEMVCYAKETDSKYEVFWNYTRFINRQSYREKNRFKRKARTD